ncbi:hypothetical protein CFP65_7335 [Kitasatospora sp. MMS16-BH015]|uniref:hypothetical protein n=1 Tax=Kitasatospora sp. MMS16-BH015 TaxID=2018025 RepID=UPI000CA33019|nr:hypothetical protein [Kitasatospora sp. MMS16-BH015]AUG81921.1 hypothetical protein CFP65_7335 [Kitasatospora sp. MMS16-BH015]
MNAHTPHHHYCGTHDLHRTVRRVAAVCIGWYAVILVSQQAHPGPDVRTAALGVHLLSLAVGFGAVLAVDGMGLAVLAGRARLATLLAFSARAEWLIWSGFLGLAVSGTALRPDFGDRWTAVNLTAALVAALNGVFAHRLRTTLPATTAASTWRDLPASYLWRASAAAVVSQVAWWTSILIGTLTS